MRGRAGAWLAGTLLIGLMLASFLPLDPLSQDLTERFSPPSWEHPLGTDQFGRDLLARLLVGARLSLGLTLLLLLATATIGIVLGMLAAQHPGLTALLVDRVTDVLVSVPGIVIGLILAAALDPGLSVLVLAVLIEGWTPHARISRNLTADVLRTEYVTAAVALGASRRHVLRREVLPNIARPLVAHACLRFASVLLTLSGLSFLGLGAQPPVPEWGAMIAEGRRYLSQAPGLLLAPATAVVLCTMAAGVLGRAWDRRTGSLAPLANPGAGPWPRRLARARTPPPPPGTIQSPGRNDQTQDSPT